jgi:ribonucleoside-diphosphate reductase beta chain
MIKTLAWQWEADSIAAYNIIPIVAPFISSTELWIAWVKVGEIENLHALTYSEIVRNSFADPALVMAEILAETEALKRISTVARAFSKIKDISLRVATGEISRDSDEAYDAIMLFVCVNLIMERVQFMASFAITFAVAETGAFLPIGQYVQKICTDELQIHVKLNKAILNNELRLSRGKASYARIKSTVNQIYDEVMQSELDWTDYTLPPGKELIGVDAPSIKAWQLFNGADVVDFLNLTPAIPVVRSNPLPWIKGWIDINLIQGSPQEARPGNYLLGGVVDTAANRVFDIDF